MTLDRLENIIMEHVYPSFMIKDYMFIKYHNDPDYEFIMAIVRGGARVSDDLIFMPCWLLDPPDEWLTHTHYPINYNDIGHDSRDINIVNVNISMDLINSFIANDGGSIEWWVDYYVNMYDVTLRSFVGSHLSHMLPANTTIAERLLNQVHNK